MSGEDFISETRRDERVDNLAVLNFAAGMMDKLRANSYKTHWSVAGIGHLFKRLIDEVHELDEALLNDITNSDKESALAIMSECYDVANFAMMIADNLSNPNLRRDG